MNKENMQINLQEELTRAEEALRAGDLLFANFLLKDAVSRLYYAVLHTVRAVLLSKGFEPKSHEGALRLLSLHFVKAGVFAPDMAHIFSSLMKYRGEADYNPSYVFTQEDYMAFKHDAVRVTTEIRDYLTAEGFKLPRL